MSSLYIRRSLARILLALCLTCAGGGRTEGAGVSSDAALSGRCAQALAALARSFGAEPSVDGEKVRVGKDELRLRANFEGEGRAPAGDRYAAGLAVEVWVNGSPQPLAAGSVGVGDNREEALATAVSEWAHLAGVAVLSALGVRGKNAFSSNLGRFSVHPGMTGFRGPQAVPWSDERQRELLDKLKGVAGELERSPAEFHTVSVMLIVETDGTSDGECRVDGVASAEALKAVRSYPWPRASATYMFKQFYVLRRLPAAAQ